MYARGLPAFCYLLKLLRYIIATTTAERCLVVIVIVVTTTNIRPISIDLVDGSACVARQTRKDSTVGLSSIPLVLSHRYSLVDGLACAPTPIYRVTKEYSSSPIPAMPSS